jgi:hypothetical protein
MKLSLMDNRLFGMFSFGFIVIILLINLTEIIYRAITKRDHKLWTKYLAFIGIGLIGALICGLHAYGEIVNRSNKLDGLIFEANTGRSLVNIPTDQWTGWIAITIIPSLFISGVIVTIMTCIIVIWCFWGITKKHTGSIMILLFLITMLFGGGFIPILIGVISGVFGIILQKSIRSAL